MAPATPTKKKTPIGTPHKTTLKAISKEKITPRKPRPGAQAVTPTAKPISKTTETTPRKSRPEATASKPIAKPTKSGGSMTAAYDKTKLSCGPNGDVKRPSSGEDDHAADEDDGMRYEDYPDDNKKDGTYERESSTGDSGSELEKWYAASDSRDASHDESESASDGAYGNLEETSGSYKVLMEVSMLKEVSMEEHARRCGCKFDPSKSRCSRVTEQSDDESDL